METVLHGITIEDVQKLLEQTVQDIRGDKIRSNILSIDVNYLHSFYVSDMDYISKICKLGRYIQDFRPWHNMLERWYNDQTVRDHFGREIKPKQLVRTFDRIVNEGLQQVAIAMLGGTPVKFKFHALGEGEDLEDPLPSDDHLVDEISRIDVTTQSNGGGLSRDGSTLYFVGNHPANLATAEITETGIFSTNNPSTDLMLDHSVFPIPIDHDIHEDSAGSTTVVYMCGV